MTPTTMPSIWKLSDGLMMIGCMASLAGMKFDRAGLTVIGLDRGLAIH
jgi:hypothetical protein